MTEKKTWKLVQRNNHQEEIKVGESMMDFRKEKIFKLTAVYPPGTNQGGQTGKVFLERADGGASLFYPTVIGAEFVIWVEKEE